MITCPNCQTENRLGAIFCRSCGAKLSIDDLNIQNFEEKTGVVSKAKVDKSKKKRRLIVNIIRLALLLLLAYGVFLVFQKPVLPDKTTRGAERENFIAKQKLLLNAKKANREIQLDFTEVEINSYVTDLVDKIDEKSRVKLEGVIINLKNENNVEIFLETTIFGREIIASCRGKVSADENGLKFEPDGFFAARMGKLPYPMSLFKYMTKNVLLKVDQLDDLMNAISSIEITEDLEEYKKSVASETPKDIENRKKDAKKGRARVKFK